MRLPKYATPAYNPELHLPTWDQFSRAMHQHMPKIRTAAKLIHPALGIAADAFLSSTPSSKTMFKVTSTKKDALKSLLTTLVEYEDDLPEDAVILIPSLK